MKNMVRVSFVVFNATFNNIIFSYIVAVSFIGGGNRRKPPTCRNFIKITNYIKKLEYVFQYAPKTTSTMPQSSKNWFGLVKIA